jgi:hypothetical protein
MMTVAPRQPLALAACAAVLALAAAAGPLVAQQAPVGVSNLRAQDQTDRATGGVRVVLLRVQERNGALAADMTSIRNTFMPVDEFRYEGDALRVVFGSYTYTLHMDGDRMVGSVVSPLGTQDIEGTLQHRGLMYVGDEAEPFRTTRPGVLGHRALLEPPSTEADPAAWVRARISSVDDVALVVGRRAKVAVSFTNARAFEAELLALAGQPVTIVGTWVGERLEIESIEPGTP